MKQNREFEGHVTLVTGGNTGIGRGIVQAFAERGSDVVIGYFVGEDAAEKLAQECESEGGVNALAVYADIRKPEEVAQMMHHTRGRLGRLDHLVCNAAAQHCKPLTQMSDDEMREIVDTNLLGSMYCTRDGAKLMRETAGDKSIMFVSSINAVMSQVGLAVYGATKGGLEALTRGLSRELAPIRVNAVQPGPTATERTLGNPSYRRWGEVVPTGRVSEIDDVADAVTFLASKRAGNINGVVLPINGGLTNIRATPQDIQRG